jgi:hypothetical protein
MALASGALRTATVGTAVSRAEREEPVATTAASSTAPGAVARPVDSVARTRSTGSAGGGARGNRHLRPRVMEFRRYGDGHAVGHQGGRRIWQLADAEDFVLAWMVTGNDDPQAVEAELLHAFLADHGKLPIGNRTWAGGTERDLVGRAPRVSAARPRRRATPRSALLYAPRLSSR